jgi:hypothetical protein
MPLEAALEKQWPSDAHCVTYITAGVGQCQPRLTKPDFAAWGAPVWTTTLMADVDNVDHGAWTEETLAAAVEQHRTLPILRTAGWYTTAHGRRIVQPLAEPVQVPAVEDLLRRWLTDLEAAGVPVDMACVDWTRHFRLPHVRREVRP